MNELSSDVMIELHVPSFEIAKKFYGDLGFSVVWERNSNNPNTRYLVMKRGKSIINFFSGSEEVYNHSFFKKFPKTTPRGYAVEIIIPIEGIENFFNEIKNKYPENIVKPLEKMFTYPDFRIVDPFGFYLRFVERYNWVEGRDKSGNSVE